MLLSMKIWRTHLQLKNAKSSQIEFFIDNHLRPKINLQGAMWSQESWISRSCLQTKPKVFLSIIIWPGTHEGQISGPVKVNLFCGRSQNNTIKKTVALKITTP